MIRWLFLIVAIVSATPAHAGLRIGEVPHMWVSPLARETPKVRDLRFTRLVRQLLDACREEKSCMNAIFNIRNAARTEGVKRLLYLDIATRFLRRHPRLIAAIQELRKELIPEQ